MLPYETYAPRPRASHGLIEQAGHRLKLYTIRHGGTPMDLDAYRKGIGLALSGPPRACPQSGRAGLGFVTVHRGRRMDYVVVAWWDRENELPVQVLVRTDGLWREAAEDESFCVWDLEIIADERDAYVDAVLSEVAAGSNAYMAHRATG